VNFNFVNFIFILQLWSGVCNLIEFICMCLSAFYLDYITQTLLTFKLVHFWLYSQSLDPENDGLSLDSGLLAEHPKKLKADFCYICQFDRFLEKEEILKYCFQCFQWWSIARLRVQVVTAASIMSWCWKIPNYLTFWYQLIQVFLEYWN